jgi:hypothetical protein
MRRNIARAKVEDIDKGDKKDEADADANGKDAEKK